VFVPTRVTVVVLGYGAEHYLRSCLTALAADLDGTDEIVLVDNGIDPGVLAGWPLPASVRVVGDGNNLGFAGGCNAGAAAGSGEVLVFVNSDAVVRPGAVQQLVSASRRPGAGIVSGCLRLADTPELVNSVGNPLHFLGITWAGHCGEPAAAHQSPGPVAVATGGLFALRRAVWDDLGGFDPVYFAYHEDTDLSLRAWLAGLSVDYEPAAVADHHYEFSRNALKMYLLERNRLITVLTDYPRPLLAAVALPLVAVELPLLAAAAIQGWAPQKLRAWGWLLRHPLTVARRRARVQARVRVPVSTVARLMVARIEPPMVSAPPGMGLLNAVLARYWSVVRSRLS
jgi:GT2 family glycosyltransferase